MLKMPVEVRAEGKGEKYAISIPTYACKEDLKQAVEDDMLKRNNNFIQSAELVCSQLLCTSLISLPNYSFILMCYYTGNYGVDPKKQFFFLILLFNFINFIIFLLFFNFKRAKR